MHTAALVGIPEPLGATLHDVLAQHNIAAVFSASLSEIPHDDDLALIVVATDSPTDDVASLRRLTAAPLLIIGDTSTGERATALALGADCCLSLDDGNDVIGQQILALLRRYLARSAPRPKILEVGAVRIDVRSRHATIDGTDMRLSPREFNVLVHFLRNPQRAFRRHELLAEVWGSSWVGEPATVDVHVSWLRQKLPPSSGVRITTVRGIGYRLDVIDERNL